MARIGVWEGPARQHLKIDSENLTLYVRYVSLLQTLSVSLCVTRWLNYPLRGVRKGMPEAGELAS